MLLKNVTISVSICYFPKFAQVGEFLNSHNMLTRMKWMDCVGLDLADFSPTGDRLCFLRQMIVVGAGRA